MAADSPMPPSDSLLSEQLLEFHTELVALRRQLSEQVEPGDQGLALAKLSERLRGQLDWQSAQALGQGGRFVHEYELEARYLKVALADEMLIGLTDWPLRDEWIACPLEQQLFGTRSAGERVFDRIERLLREAQPARRDMAQQYLLALSMGFQGRYRGGGRPQEVLQKWRLDLYRFIAGGPPDEAMLPGREEDFHDLGRRLMPQAYAHTASDAPLQRLPSPRRWMIVFVLLALALLLASQWIWHAGTAPLSEQFERSTAQRSAP